MFIIGLPRSRTAWLSAFMSQSGVYFYHEAINGCNSIGEYKDKIKGCGDSTTGFEILNYDVVTPEAKIVIIEKNEIELKRCIAWCNETYSRDCTDLIKSLNSKLENFNGLVVKQSEINDRLKEIWCHLINVPWCDKYENIKNLNIQVESPFIDEAAANNLHASIQ